MFKFLDNKKNGFVGEELKQIIDEESRISIISSYFTINAFNELKKELKKVDKARFIILDKSFASLEENPTKEKITGNEFERTYRNNLNQAYIAKECANWLQKRASVKGVKKMNTAFSRMINVEKGKENTSIFGTVDFTGDGLGFVPSDRGGINQLIVGGENTEALLNTFEELWNDSTQLEDIKGEILNHLTQLYKENTPEFLYFMTLYNIFNDYLNEVSEDKIIKASTGFKDSIVWNKLYKFQKDGVLGAIEKLERHNGCIISDSVGLGKTFSALAVIKYYELRNDRVLVMAPKKLRDNWTVYTLNDKRNLLCDDRFNYDVLNHTDLSRYKGYSGEINLETLNWENYDLIVIDESHNFRNNNPVKDKETRYSRLMNQVIKKGVKTKVLMLSATPVNNKMTDLKNQIAFITEGNDKAFEEEGILSINSVLKKTQKVFNDWSDLPDEERTIDQFVNMMDTSYFKLLDTVTIARSRKHIQKYYGTSEIGNFPTRRKPINIYSDIDTVGEFPPIASVNKMIKNLHFAQYSPLGYILPEKRAEYGKKYDMQLQKGNSVFKQEDREKSLVGLMRILLLKRLESSINSFGKTVTKQLKMIDNILEQIKNNMYELNEDLSILDIDEDDPMMDSLMIGEKVKVLFQDIDLIKWTQDLEDDRDSLEDIQIRAARVTIKSDAKIEKLKKLMAEKFNNPINDGNKKMIIFTASADTASYLYEDISEWAMEKFNLHSAMVSGSGENQTTLKGIRKKDLNAILTNFSPISKERNKVFPKITEEIDILIATDCISEGQNLQDCDYLVNYDIHWNPMRIIQRFGRIDRLGSKNDEIQLVNFWPDMELDEYINLEARVTGRMVLLDVSATGEENVISTDERRQMNDLEYRKKQLTQLQERVVDLEDISGGISITDLTMNDFKIDLTEHLEKNQENKPIFDNFSTGLYSVVALTDELKEQGVQPGVIFTLKYTKEHLENYDKNPLFPYYMMYMTEEGELKYSYVNSKKILDLYKKICKANNTVDETLVEKLNNETRNGKDMSPYKDLFVKSVESIIGKTKEERRHSLFNMNGSTYHNENISGINDFEVVSYLIIKER